MQPMLEGSQQEEEFPLSFTRELDGKGCIAVHACSNTIVGMAVAWPDSSTSNLPKPPLHDMLCDVCGVSIVPRVVCCVCVMRSLCCT